MAIYIFSHLSLHLFSKLVTTHKQATSCEALIKVVLNLCTNVAYLIVRKRSFFFWSRKFTVSWKSLYRWVLMPTLLTPM